MKKASGKSNIQIVRDMQAGVRPFTQVGYEAAKEVREVGDIWEDSKGKTWIKTEYGIRSHNPKADLIKEEINKKWMCRRCNKDHRWSSNPLDEKVLNKTGMCFNCLTEYETELRLNGQFKDYENKKILQNKLSYANDMLVKLKESYEYTKNNPVIKYVNANGMVEEWENSSRDQLLEELLIDQKACSEAVEELKSEISKLPEFDSDISKKIEFVPSES